MINLYKLGFHAQSPRMVVAKINEFNICLKQTGGDNPTIGFDIYDVKELFTNVPRGEMLEIVRHYIERTANEFPGMLYF